MRVFVRSYEVKVFFYYFFSKIRGLLLCVLIEEEIFEIGDDIESRSCWVGFLYEGERNIVFSGGFI